MFIHEWKKQIFTIPNILSLFRIFLIPVYTSIYLSAAQPREYWIAGSILAVSCLTDLFDGKIARKYNMISTLGKILDPVADKLTQFAITWCLSIKYPVMRFVLALFVLKEGFQGIVGIIHLRNGKMLPGALMAGKVCTTVLFSCLIFLVLMPNIKHELVCLIAFIDTAFLFVAFLHYFFAYFGRNPKLEDLQK